MKEKVLKFTAFVFILTSLSFVANAQIDRVWSISPEIGANFSKYGMDAKGSDYKTGLLAGVALNYSIINTYGVTVKLLFSQKGAEYSVNGANNKQTLNYLEIPIVGRYYFNREGRFRPNLFVGPSIAFLLDAKNKVGDGERNSLPESERKNFSGFDFGLTGGVGLNYEILPEKRVLLDARYTHGLTDIKDPGTVNNKAISVNLGMSFGF